MTPLGKYMFLEKPTSSESGKTQLWWVLDRYNNSLGLIKWFGRWRCYAFFPEDQTVFNAACMQELAGFCKTQTKALTDRGRAS